MNYNITLIIVLSLLFIILIISVNFLISYKKAKKLFGDGFCTNKECEKPQQYLPLDGSIFGRGYLCSNCGTFVYFPVDFSKPKSTLLNPFEKDEDIEEDEEDQPVSNSLIEKT